MVLIFSFKLYCFDGVCLIVCNVFLCDLEILFEVVFVKFGFDGIGV